MAKKEKEEIKEKVRYSLNIGAITLLGVIMLFAGFVGGVSYTFHSATNSMTKILDHIQIEEIIIDINETEVSETMFRLIKDELIKDGPVYNSSYTG